MGQGQAVQLPVDFHLEGSEVEVRRNTATGELILRGISNAPMVSWKERFAVWDALGSPDEDVLERSTNLPVEREFMR
jgi:virulence-associated protein VagC